ncbi:hypothetical protein [Amycolatopsis sp. lyj-108]|uniref:hypothetical protein n=1 Tax=Amycolatopsis sp. lyj-108 TaxID=2789286 RepID=UPI00397DBA8A
MAVPLLPVGRRGLGLLCAAVRSGQLRWWHLTGGVCGALFVAGQGISVGSVGVAGYGAWSGPGMLTLAVATIVVRRIGVLVFGLASVAGQLLGAVLLDAITFLALLLAARPVPERR